MFGTLPAYGFSVRHAKNISLRHVDLSFQHDDARPAMICDDVADLEIAGFDAQGIPSTAGGLLHLKQTRGAWFHGCRLKRPTPTFLRVDGDRSAQISLLGNDLSNAKNSVKSGSDVSTHALHAENH